ncbi:hypothetical protein ACQKWADRAFT_307024 [Trichoderma austrokoningii]
MPKAMGDAGDNQVYEQDLDAALLPAFRSISTCITDPDIKWCSLLPNQVRECVDPSVKERLAPLDSARIIHIYRNPASIRFLQAAYLILLRPCERCCVREGGKSYALHSGKMMHIPPPEGKDELYIEVEEGRSLYLLWVLKKSDPSP